MPNNLVVLILLNDYLLHPLQLLFQQFMGVEHILIQLQLIVLLTINLNIFTSTSSIFIHNLLNTLFICIILTILHIYRIFLSYSL